MKHCRNMNNCSLKSQFSFGVDATQNGQMTAILDFWWIHREAIMIR